MVDSLASAIVFIKLDDAGVGIGAFDVFLGSVGGGVVHHDHLYLLRRVVQRCQRSHADGQEVFPVPVDDDDADRGQLQFSPLLNPLEVAGNSVHG